MHPILKAQIREASTARDGQHPVLDVGALLEIVTAFYDWLDRPDQSPVDASIPIVRAGADDGADPFAETAVFDGRPSHVAAGPDAASFAGDDASMVDTAVFTESVDPLSSPSGLYARFAHMPEEDLRAILDSVADIVVTVDWRGEIQFANRTAVRYLGADGKALTGHNINDFLPVPAGQSIVDYLRTFSPTIAGRSGEFRAGEVTGAREDGTQFAVELTVSRLSAQAAGEYVLCMRDLTHRKYAERALHENEERYRALVEYAPEAVFVLDVDAQCFIDVNEAACRLFNLPRRRLLAAGFLGTAGEHGTAPGLAHIETYINRALRGAQPTFEWIHVHANGYEFPCEIRFSRLPATDQRLLRAVVVDITERKRNEVLNYGETKLLEMLAKGVDYTRIFMSLCRTVETVLPRARAAVMLADAERNLMRTVAAPSIGKELAERLGGHALDDARLVSGVAMATGQPALMADVSAHHAWRDDLELVGALGVASAWSFPIPGESGRPLGTIDLFLDCQRDPSTAEFDRIAGLARLAGIVINRMQGEDLLRRSEARFRGLFENVVEGVYIAEAGGRIIAANPAFVSLLGYESEADFIGAVDRQSVYADPQAASRFVQEIETHGEVRNFEAVMRHRDGTEIVVLENARALKADDGTLRHIEGTVLDITERKRNERRIFAQKERAEVTLKSIGDAVVTTDADGGIEYMNPAAEELTGWRLPAAEGRHADEVITLINEHSRELVDNPLVRCLQEGRTTTVSDNSVLVSRQGREIAIQDSAAPIRDSRGNTIGAVLVFHDVSAEGRLSRQLSYQASHDALTGFINRHEFENTLTRALAHVRKQPDLSYGLLYIDLDQFKVVNDTFGHTAGDELVRQLANLILSHLRPSDIAARLGGDEFAVLLDNSDPAHAQSVAEDIRASVESHRFEWQGATQTVRASIGVVMLNNDTTSVGMLLSAADVACFAAKDLGRNQVHLYRDSDAGLRHQEMHWISRINRAMEESRFELYFQQIVSTSAGSRQGTRHYELLLRMRDEEGNLIQPGTFIPAAERYNLMPALDRWVVTEALALADAGDPGQDAAYSLAVNLSGNSLSDDRFLEFVLEALQKRSLRRRALCFEITETAAIANLARVTHFMSEVKRLGCLFSLDDFGSGLSSFAYLKKLPVDFLKVDGTFIQNVATDTLDKSVVQAIHHVGRALGVRVVAEQVEDEQTYRALLELGVGLMQGFYVAEPQSMRTFSPWAVGAAHGSAGLRIVG